MTDQPDRKQNPLDEKYPDRYERLLPMLDKYASAGYGCSYSIQVDLSGKKYLCEHENDKSSRMTLLEGLNIIFETWCYAELMMKEDFKYLDSLHSAYRDNEIQPAFNYKEYLTSPHWKQVRKKAIERSGGRCMLCNTNTQSLHVHHRTYERLGHEEPMDVIVLCATHHAQFHGKDGNK